VACQARDGGGLGRIGAGGHVPFCKVRNSYEVVGRSVWANERVGGGGADSVGMQNGLLVGFRGSGEHRLIARGSSDASLHLSLSDSARRCWEI